MGAVLGNQRLTTALSTASKKVADSKSFLEVEVAL